MKNKFLLFLLLFSLSGSKLIAKNFDRNSNISKINAGFSNVGFILDTVKKSNKTLKTRKSLAIIPPPQTTAGSACIEEGEASVKVFMSASGGSGDLVEWYSSQSSSTVLFTGSIYGPNISETTTYYVRTSTGPDFSVRVPVVASVYSSPPAVSLSVIPEDAVICEGAPLVFIATGGADLFEFSIDGIVKQFMSANKEFQTSELKKGQIVGVRTRYAINFDGNISETAWGKGAMEDNNLSAPLSIIAASGYVNSIKISPTEDKLVFGMAGKLESNRSILVFLDTKPGGFNVSNYGDEADAVPSARGFNYFNNNPSTFDSYFQADFCLTISTDDGGTNYFADVIELKTGTSIKTRLGRVATGSPSSVMGVDSGNLGIDDYNLGFEVEVLKSLIGYTVGDIKFFALTMQDDTESNYNVTNSFLSPELSGTSDYGSGAIDYNTKDPNPVVVSADALIPCYKEASISVNLNEKPTVASVGPDQVNCSLTSGALGGNTPEVGSGVWTLKSGPGAVSFSDANSGNSTATVDLEGMYVFTWSISNGVCPTSTADIIVEFNIAPLTPTASDLTECASSPIQTLTATATSQTGETIVWYDAATGGNVVSDPSLSALGTITYYAESAKDSTPCVSGSRTAVTLTINPNPIVPVSGGDQTECALSPVQTLTAAATAEVGGSVVWYDAVTGGNVVTEPSLSALGTISYYAESEDDATSCVSASRTEVTLTLNPKPIVPVSDGDKTECALSPIQTLTAIAKAQAGESVVWYDAATEGNVVPDPSLNELGTITYYAESANDSTPCVSSSRTTVTLTINPNPIVPVSGGDQMECALSPIQTLTATATVEAGESVVWYDSASDGNVVADPSLGTLGTITYYAEAEDDVTFCVSTSRVAVKLTLNPKPIVPLSGGDQTECVSSSVQTLTATATAQSGESLVWYDAAIGGNFISDPSLSTVGTITYFAESGNEETACVSSSRTAVTLTINPNPIIPVGGGDQTDCAASPIQTLTATATSQVGESVVWYDANTDGNIIAEPSLSSLGSITYYAESVNDATACASTSRVAISLTINPRPEVPVSGGDLTECTDGTTTQTLTATAEGNSISWYTTDTGGSPVSEPTQVGVGATTYYAESSDGVCESLTRTAVKLTIVGVVPNPTANDQTICSDGTADQTITAIAVGDTITWYTDLVGGTVVSNPVQVGVGTATYYAESSIGNCLSDARTEVMLSITATPSMLTATVSKQPTCVDPTGEITIGSQTDAEYSIGEGFQDSPIFTNLQSGSYTVSVRFKNNTSCEIKGASQTINPIPAEIQFESTGDCINKEYIITASPLASSYDSNNVDYQWKDNLGNPIATNSNTLNGSDIIASSSAEVTFPLNYTLTITSMATGCETTNNIVIESVFCNIQKGISPDGNGSNDYFDLRLLDVKKLQIFDRYGIKVYSQINYTNQWTGQSDNGNELPSATYYYVMEFDNGVPKTGWIYLIREK
ncbi:gliding motility-associated C-terminal domain-containing protein [Flavobacterium sp. W22_SRS_FP1]|uniref:Ig-like domain-containing protein n=1 Tax=Flavobacterium sp. W22_SRS_FP1 TaxID=3240276 RepID=UPI003F91DF26